MQNTYPIKAENLKANRPIGAELRGTGPQMWRGLAPGTDKNAGFFWTGDAGSRTILLCESAIDAISCREFFPECLAISTDHLRLLSSDGM